MTEQNESIAGSVGIWVQTKGPDSRRFAGPLLTGNQYRLTPYQHTNPHTHTYMYTKHQKSTLSVSEPPPHQIIAGGLLYFIFLQREANTILIPPVILALSPAPPHPRQDSERRVSGEGC